MVRDVVIVGCGVAGSRLALKLASAGLDVLLIGDVTGRRPYFESLSSTVSGCLPDLALSRPCSLSRSAWGTDDVFERAGILNPHGHDWFVDRASLDAAAGAALDAAGVPRRSARVTGVTRRDGRWTVRTSTPGTEVLAAFLVDATGRRSSLGTRLGSRKVALDRLVATPFRLEGADETFGFGTTVVSLPSGWLYAGPGTRSRAVGIYFTDPDLDAYAGLRRPERLQQLLAASPVFAGCGAGARYGGVAAFSERLHPCFGPGWLAVGDAAASVDPLSSQGLARAVQGADRAAEAMLRGDIAAYGAAVEADYRAYASHRADVYGRETRWADSPFWRRRTTHDAAPI